MPGPRLKPADVRAIRRLAAKQITIHYGEGGSFQVQLTQTQIAHGFGVTLNTVCDILHRRSWKHLDEEKKENNQNANPE